MTEIIDLRPNKCFLNPNFEKYQFCPVGIPKEIERKLENEVFHVELSPSQESWLEVRLFALHNHLFMNRFDESCWFVDNAGVAWRFTKTGNLEKVHTLKPQNENQMGSKYNPSIGFASNNITVISNGSKNLEFLIDGLQNQLFIFDDVNSGIIMDVQHVKENSHIIVSIYDVAEVEGKKSSRLTLLTYSYQKDEGSSPLLSLFRKQILKVKGSVEYIHVEENGNYFHTASHDPIVFDYDSLYPIDKDQISGSVQEIKIPKYCWSQDEDSVTIWLKIPDKCNNISAKIDVNSTKISVRMKDVVLIEGVTQHKLEPDLATLKTKDDTLEIEFTKSESGLMWSELIKGDTGGEFLPNEALVAEIHSRLAHLCADQPESTEQSVIGFNAEQLEECDLTGRENILQRVNMNTHSTSTLSMLGSSNCVIFTQKIKTGQMLCLRHDHDSCVWVSKQTNAVEDKWALEHIWTFPGFGYVEAGKTNKKFIISPPNGSFIAIVEHTRHIFVYQKPENDATIGKQYIINFGSETSPILGAAGLDEYLIVLTKNMLYRFQVY